MSGGPLRVTRLWNEPVGLMTSTLSKKMEAL